MSITEGTQPAAITWTGAWTTAQTTASFTPEAGALIVALLSADGDGIANTTATISDSLSGTWTQLAMENTAATGLGGIAGVWCRDSTNTSMTVSVTGGVHTANGGQLTVRTLIGAKATASQNGATGIAGPAPGAIQVSVAAGTGNKIYGGAFNFDTSTAMTPLGNTSVINQVSDSTNGDDWESFKSSGDTAGTATYGYSTSVHGMIAAAEIIAAPSTAAPGVTRMAAPGQTWLRRFHHRQFLPQAFPATTTTAGTAALDGNGTLTAAPYFDPSPVTLSGAGTLSATPTATGTAALSGLGTLSNTSVNLGIALSGTGTLSATYTSSGAPPAPVVIQAQPQPPRQPAPLGSQILGGAPVVTYTEGASLSGVGSLNVAPAFTATSSLSGLGTLTASPVLGATPTLTGIGTLTAAPVFTGGASLSGAGTLTNVSVNLGILMSGSGTLAASTLAGSATLTGLGTLTAAPVIGATPTLTGVGTLTAAETIGTSTAPSGTGTLSAVTRLGIQAALAGLGTLNVAPAFQVARSTASVAALATSAPTVTDPRDGTSGVT